MRRNPLDNYRIVERDNEEIPYELHGPRGAHYGLMRNANNRHLLFVVNLRHMGVVERLGWFSDADGSLRPVKLL
jgi:hypothetical protein